jgi:hypothetical protein
MKNIITGLTVLLLSGTVSGQWKAQSGETYGKSFRMAYVTSVSGGETLRLLRTKTPADKQKATDPYEQITGQVLLNNKPDKDNTVQGLVLRFDESPKIYIHQHKEFKQTWDNGARKYIIESDWQLWRIEDSRDKEVKNIASDSDQQAKAVSVKEIIALLKSGKKVYCQVILLNTVYGTQSIINAEFTLQNSTKSITYLFK